MSDQIVVTVSADTEVISVQVADRQNPIQVVVSERLVESVAAANVIGLAEYVETAADAAAASQVSADAVEVSAVNAANDRAAAAHSAYEAAVSASQAEVSRIDATMSASSTAQLLANAGSMLGINFGAFVIEDGELIATHLSTTELQLVDGELIITYETL